MLSLTERGLLTTVEHNVILHHWLRFCEKGLIGKRSWHIYIDLSLIISRFLLFVLNALIVPKTLVILNLIVSVGFYLVEPFLHEVTQ